MDLGLSDKVAVVTGGSSGIGLAAARIFLEEGARVAICGRSRDRLAGAERSLAGPHGADRVLSAACDVLDPAQVADFRDRVAERFGRADILVANAGQARRGGIEDLGDDEWRAELDLSSSRSCIPPAPFCLCWKRPRRRPSSARTRCWRGAPNPGLRRHPPRGPGPSTSPRR